MRKVFMGLSIASALFGVVCLISDIVDGQFGEDTVMGVVFIWLLTALFAYLAHLWKHKSPIKRTVEQASQVTRKLKKHHKEYEEASPAMKKRIWSFHIVGILISISGVFVCFAGNWRTIPIVVGTVLLIIGIAVFMMGSPSEYNEMTDGAAMITLDSPRKIEEFYEAFKNIKTPLGSGWLGRFYTSPYTSLIFGPDDRGQFLYFWLSGDGVVGYIGYSFLSGTIKKHVTEPLIPYAGDFAKSTAEHLCYHTDVFLFQDWLKESLEKYIKTGKPVPFRESEPSEVYVFTEDFKMTGQHFELTTPDGEPVYEIDGTVPLLNLHIYDTQHTEIFKMTKEVGHALATYSFFYRGEPYGVLEKQFALVRDTFVMDIKEGRLELKEYAGTIGHNFRVTLNGRMIGAIMDNLELSWSNVFFDNSFLLVYDKEYLPLLTAMAVMVARELARDEDGGLSNSI